MIIIIVIIIVIVFVQERELIIMPNCLFYFELGKEKMKKTWTYFIPKKWFLKKGKRNV